MAIYWLGESETSSEELRSIAATRLKSEQPHSDSDHAQLGLFPLTP